jgi:hypothetical protein
MKLGVIERGRGRGGEFGLRWLCVKKDLIDGRIPIQGELRKTYLAQGACS